MFRCTVTQRFIYGDVQTQGYGWEGIEHFACHHPVGEGAPYPKDWTLTHLPTGRSVCEGLATRAQAEKVARTLESVAAWDGTNPNLYAGGIYRDCHAFVKAVSNLAHKYVTNPMEYIQRQGEAIFA